MVFIKSFFLTVRRVLLALAGGLGGVVVGGLASLMIFHMKVAYSIEMHSWVTMVFLAFAASIFAGMMFPRFFMWFFLSPLACLMDGEASGGGHPSGDFDVNWPGFLTNASYMIGLPLYGFGAIFSLTWMVGIGLLGILVFTVGVYRLSGRSKGEQKHSASTP